MCNVYSGTGRQFNCRDVAMYTNQMARRSSYGTTARSLFIGLRVEEDGDRKLRLREQDGDHTQQEDRESEGIHVRVSRAVSERFLPSVQQLSALPDRLVVRLVRHYEPVLAALSQRDGKLRCRRRMGRDWQGDTRVALLDHHAVCLRQLFQLYFL